MVSFAIADAAREHGAQLATGVPVARIVPGEGVVLEDGTPIRARTVVANADPKVTLRLLDGQDVPSRYRVRLEAWKVRSPVVKYNAVLGGLPAWTAARGERQVAQATTRRRRRRATTCSASSASTRRTGSPRATGTGAARRSRTSSSR
jgi:phytoene dehydrogenase-like protein